MSEDTRPPEGIPALAHIPRATVAALLRRSTRVSLRKGRVLYYQGDRADRAYLVMSGELRRVLYRSNETTAELGRSARGEWLGLAETYLQSLYLTDAVAESAAELYAFSRSGVLQALGDRAFAEHVLSELARELYLLHARVEVSLPMDRTIRYLLDHAGADGGVSVTQEDLAAAVGLARETVNRHLSQLQAEGAVRVERGGVRIADRAALAARGAGTSGP